MLEPRSDGGAAGTEVLLGEVLALRTILLNLMFSLTNGKPVTSEAMRELIEKADGDKSRRAMERLTAVAATVPESKAESSLEPEPTATQQMLERRAEMAEWGRKEYKKPWPSRRPVWGIGAFFAATLVFAGMLTIQYERSWTAAEGLYWKDYLKSGARGQTSARSVSKYTLLEGMTAKGRDGKEQGLFLKGDQVETDQVETVTDPDGKQGWRLTEAGAKLGIARLQWVTGTFNDRALHRLLGSVVYADVEGWEFYRVPVYTALAFFVLLLFVAVPRDRKRRMVWKHGRRLRGPELVTTAELNEKLGKSKLLTTTLPDGVAFINEEQTWIDKLIRKQESRWARIPRRHLLTGSNRPEHRQQQHPVRNRFRPQRVAL